jgi:ribosomal protein L36
VIERERARGESEHVGYVRLTASIREVCMRCKVIERERARGESEHVGYVRLTASIREVCMRCKVIERAERGSRVSMGVVCA